MMQRIVFARIGAVLYAVWGLLHLTAALSIYQLGLGAPPGMVQGRLFQTAFYIVCFAIAAITLAARMNWRNSRTGFWANALIVGLADIPFFLFVLAPGYAPYFPGVVGPALWLAAMTFTGLARMQTPALAPTN